MEPKLILHGGAGHWQVDGKKRGEVERALVSAIRTGLDCLKKGTAVDALVSALREMEDSGLFNAGRGAYPNIEYDIELDAGIMDGSNLAAGAVASVKNVKNPILLAQLVMEKTKHVLIAGEGAERLAKAFRLHSKTKLLKEREDYARKNIETYIKAQEWLKGLRKFYSVEVNDTIGGVAIDRDGNLAAATSTGGTLFKLPGRVGDSPLPGGGFYAMNGRGAASATGEGEDIMKYCLSCKVVMDLDGKTDPFKVLIRELDEMRRLFGRSSAGAVAIDYNGRGGVYTTTRGIAVGWGSKKDIKSKVAYNDQLFTVNAALSKF